MKKSILLGISALAIFASGIAVANSAKPVETQAITDGQSIYLDCSNTDYQWWVNDVDDDNSDDGGVVIGLYTWNGGTNTKVRGHRVKGYKNNYLFEFVFNVTPYANILFFRAKESLEGEWYNQSHDWNNFKDVTNNVWSVSSYSSNKYGLSNNTNVSYANRASYFGKYFLDTVGCDPQGTSAPTGWSAVSNEYGAMTTSAKEQVVNATASQTGTDLQKAVARYDYAVTHNKLITDKFITGRSSSGALNVVGIPSANSLNSGALIAGLAGLGLAAAGTMIFFAKKRKEI